MKLALPMWMPIDAFRKDLEHIISPDTLTGEIVVQYMGKNEPEILTRRAVLQR